MRTISAILLLSLTGCYHYKHIDRSSFDLHTEAQGANINYESGPFYIGLTDSKKDLANLRPIPGTAFIWSNMWEDSISYRLVLKDISFDRQKDGRVNLIGFYMDIDFPKGHQSEIAPSLKPGLYNISVQFSGSPGIFTLCGSFKIINELKYINGNDLH
jgi:hypothetical protein